MKRAWITVGLGLALVLIVAPERDGRALAQEQRTPLRGPARETSPSVYTLLEELRQGYAERPSYKTSGQIERLTLRGDAVLKAEFFEFELAFDRGVVSSALRLTVSNDVQGRRVAWLDDEGAWFFDENGHEGATVQRAESLTVAVAAAVGRGGREALPVAGLLIQEATALPTPEAAVLEGAQPCPGGESGASERTAKCYLLTLSREGGAVEMDLWVDCATTEIRRLEARLEPTAGRDLPPAGWDPWSEAALRTVVRVRFPTPADPGVRAEEAGFSIPAGVQRVRKKLTLASLQDAQVELAPEPVPDPPATAGVHDGGFGDTVEVRLGTVTARAVASDGTVLKGLKPEDFRVYLGRREVAVRAVDWVDSKNPMGSDLPPEVLAETGITVDPPGKLIVLFVQADMHPSRAGGHLRLLPRLKELLETFDRDDQVAVVSYDSHLKLQLDFTRDHERIVEAVQNSIRRRPPPRIPAGRYPSLARTFDVAAGKDAAIPEEGLRVTAEALIPLHGEKVMVYAGWGLGRYNFGGVSMPREYDQALEALGKARTSVFVLDITSADFHTLELGLKQVAVDTGGEYFRTFRFVGQMVHRLGRSLDGHYIVTFELPPRDKRSRLRVELAPGRKGEVLIQSRTYRPTLPEKR